MKPEHSELRITDISPSSPEEGHPLPAFLSAVQAGFPSPADDYVEHTLDINKLVVKHPAATFFVRVEGDSMTDANIQSGDILVVDRSEQASTGKIVVAILNGEFTVKRLVINNSGTYLVPENKKFSPIKVNEDSNFQVWGIVTYVIHKAR